MKDIRQKRYTKTEAFWVKAIKDFEECSQTIKEFCQARELREGTFYKWKRRLELRKANVSSFIPLKIVDDKERIENKITLSSSPREVAAEIIFRDGTTLRLKDICYQDLIKVLR
jgi:hypothetical protein